MNKESFDLKTNDLAQSLTSKQGTLLLQNKQTLFQKSDFGNYLTILFFSMKLPLKLFQFFQHFKL